MLMIARDSSVRIFLFFINFYDLLIVFGRRQSANSISGSVTFMGAPTGDEKT
jgi:hypothetical protein